MKKRARRLPLHGNSPLGSVLAVWVRHMVAHPAMSEHISIRGDVRWERRLRWRETMTDEWRARIHHALR